jgi:hypothetical protein
VINKKMAAKWLPFFVNQISLSADLQWVCANHRAALAADQP